MACALAPWLGKWRIEEKTDTLTHRKAAIWWTGLSDGEAATPLELIIYTVDQEVGVIVHRQIKRQGHYLQFHREAGLLHATVQRGRVITYSCTKRQGYYIQWNREPGLLHTTEQGGKVISLSWANRKVYWLSVEECLSLGYGRHFLHMPSPFTLGLEEVLAMLLSLTQENCHSHMPLPYQRHTFPEDSTNSLQPPKPVHQVNLFRGL